MLSSVQRSARAVEVNIEVMRAFVRLREMLIGNRELARRLCRDGVAPEGSEGHQLPRAPRRSRRKTGLQGSQGY